MDFIFYAQIILVPILLLTTLIIAAQKSYLGKPLLVCYLTVMLAAATTHTITHFLQNWYLRKIDELQYATGDIFEMFQYGFAAGSIIYIVAQVLLILFVCKLTQNTNQPSATYTP